MATATVQIGLGGKEGSGSTRTRPYKVSGATSTNDAIATALAQLTADLGGTTLDGYSLLSISAAETDVVGVFDAVCDFGNARGFEQQTQGETRTGFEFGQESLRLRQSLSTTRYGTRPPDHGNAIGVVKDDNGKVTVEGVDVPAPSFTFSKTIILPVTSVGNSFLGSVAGVYMHVNSDPFAGFPAGEVLFIGLTGNQRSDDEYELTYRFSRRPNESNITIGNITVTTKKGWHYLEVLWNEASDEENAAIVPSARAAYVHQVFPETAFSALGIS